MDIILETLFVFPCLIPIIVSVGKKKYPEDEEEKDKVIENDKENSIVNFLGRLFIFQLFYFADLETTEPVIKGLLGKHQVVVTESSEYDDVSAAEGQLESEDGDPVFAFSSLSRSTQRHLKSSRISFRKKRSKHNRPKFPTTSSSFRDPHDSPYHERRRPSSPPPSRLNERYNLRNTGRTSRIGRISENGRRVERRMSGREKRERMMLPEGMIPWTQVKENTELSAEIVTGSDMTGRSEIVPTNVSSETFSFDQIAGMDHCNHYISCGFHFSP